jgi:hypothetical protein
VFKWLFSPAYAAQVGGISFLLGALGTVLTLWGLFLTYRQAKRARTEAAAATQAVSDFRFRLDHYDASRDLAQAAYAMEITRRHLNNDAWKDAVDSYEEARRAIIRVGLTSVELPDEHRRRLGLVASHMQTFCNAVDAARAGKGVFPDKTKVFTTIRRHYGAIVSLQRHLEERVS